MLGFILMILLIAIVVILIFSTVKIVPQSYAYVVERIGAYDRTLNVGLHILIPLIDRVSNRVSLKEQVMDFAPQPVITKDNVTMQIDTVVYFSITDPKLFTYGVVRPINAIETLTATTLRNIIGDFGQWLRHKIRVIILKQWKRPKTIYKNLLKMNNKFSCHFSDEQIYSVANTRCGLYSQACGNVVNFIISPVYLSKRIGDRPGLVNPLKYYLS